MKRAELEEWGIIRTAKKENYLTHLLFESGNGKYAFYFSQIEEWSLLKYCTKLEIFENKNSPIKIFDNNSPWFLYDEYIPELFYDWSDFGFLCLTQLLQPEPNVWCYPIILIDLKIKKFAKLEYPHSRLQLIGDQIQVSWDKTRFRGKEDVIIPFSKLIWSEFGELRNASWGERE
jgi:hypothetical protein